MWPGQFIGFSAISFSSPWPFTKEHVLLVVLVVAGRDVRVDVVEERRLHLDVAAFGVLNDGAGPPARFQITIPFGCQNGEPGEFSARWKRSSCCPSLRWSRRRASSSRSR